MILPFLMLVGSGAYLYRDYQNRTQAAPVAVHAVVPAAGSGTMLNDKMIASLREQLASPDQDVRWAAMQTLNALEAPGAVAVLEKAMTEENDPQLRVNIVLLLKTSKDRGALKVLGLGVRDSDPTVRVAALRVLGEVGDLTATNVVAGAVGDPDADVKVAAMDALARLHAARQAQYDKLNLELRRQYEGQVKKAQADGV